MIKPRKHIVLDLETTGLDTLTAHPLEIAALEVRGDEHGRQSFLEALSFVPATDPAVIAAASPEALSVNRWYERRLYKQMEPPEYTRHLIGRLVGMLDGATLVGANPAYDAAVLWRWLKAETTLQRPPWHFRLYDVEVATAVALGLEEIPGLAKCADLWDIDVTTDDAHTAAGDTWTTAQVYAAIRMHAAARSAT